MGEQSKDARKVCTGVRCVFMCVWRGDEYKNTETGTSYSLVQCGM